MNVRLHDRSKRKLGFVVFGMLPVPRTPYLGCTEGNRRSGWARDGDSLLSSSRKPWIGSRSAVSR